MTHDMADKTTHVDIVQNPDIKSFLDECNYMQRTVKIDIFVFGAEGAAAYKTGPVCSMPASCAGAIFNSGRPFR